MQMRVKHIEGKEFKWEDHLRGLNENVLYRLKLRAGIQAHLPQCHSIFIKTYRKTSAIAVIDRFLTRFSRRN